MVLIGQRARSVMTRPRCHLVLHSSLAGIFKEPSLLHEYGVIVGIKLAGALAGTAAVAITAAFLGPAHAATDAAAGGTAVHVPCDPAILAGDLSTAAETQTLDLASGCVYSLTQGLATNGGLTLDIVGNGATLERSYARGTPFFPILQDNSFGLITDNLNFRNGTGAIVVGPGKSLEVDGGSFTANTTDYGGAIFASGPESAVTVNGATFTANNATYGGAIFDGDVFGIDVTDSEFYFNAAKYGGAIYNGSLTGESLTRVVLRSNQASADGGGIYSTYSQVTLDGGQLAANRAAGHGGGIYQQSVSDGPDPAGIGMTGTDLLGNSASQGGGIYATASIVTVKGGKISGNRASASGGGIYSAGDPSGAFGTLTLTSTALTSNSARQQGGAIYNEGHLTAAGTPFTLNHAAAGGAIYDHGRFGPGTATGTLTGSPMRDNSPDNCEPAKTVTGCTG